MKNVIKVAALMLLVCLPCSAQQGDYKSAIFNADGTVTFQYKNDNAKSVRVEAQFANGDMKKDSKTGLWTVTLGPVAPDMYPYCFNVDGVSVMDPKCDLYFPNEKQPVRDTCKNRFTCTRYQEGASWFGGVHPLLL